MFIPGIHSSSEQQAKDYRRTADYWERRAKAADEDGDKDHARRAREAAADFRDMARQIEVRMDPTNG